MFTIISRLTYFISSAANAVGTLVVLGLVCLVNFDVIARGLFHAPFLGTVELVQFSMVLIVFLQLPDVVRVNRLTRSDGLLMILANRFSFVAAVLRRMIDGVSAILMVLVTVAMYPQFLEAWESLDYFGVPGVFTAPWWPIKLTILLSAGLCAFIFLVKALVPRQWAPEIHLATPEINTEDTGKSNGTA